MERLDMAQKRADGVLSYPEDLFLHIAHFDDLMRQYQEAAKAKRISQLSYDRTGPCAFLRKAGADTRRDPAPYGGYGSLGKSGATDKPA